mmetsp:Transcript_3433/g.13631  ORF Transcript_3433/g.13631 Transcript_3433/m.13631 type:complete len:93 (-) Transcript_3433:28-306(-)
MMAAGILGGALAYSASFPVERFREDWVAKRRIDRAWERFYDERDASFHEKDIVSSWSPNTYVDSSKLKTDIFDASAADRRAAQELRERRRDS